MGVTAIADPYEVPLANSPAFATAGRFGVTVDKAARFAGLDDDVRGILAAAAAISERHGCGYGPQDGDVGALTKALGGWLAALRGRAQAA